MRRRLTMRAADTQRLGVDAPASQKPAFAPRTSALVTYRVPSHSHLCIVRRRKMPSTSNEFIGDTASMCGLLSTHARPVASRDLGGFYSRGRPSV
jgi:hypothetical protein